MVKLNVGQISILVPGHDNGPARIAANGAVLSFKSVQITP